MGEWIECDASCAFALSIMPLATELRPLHSLTMGKVKR
jgi:hypothetical protein